uniref:GID complex subunit 8 homolog a (S. cerevisiae) n=1 Tax=Cyprinus carpio TaxID=7962 RepID=A0A8C1PUN0_CYPCA
MLLLENNNKSVCKSRAVLRFTHSGLVYFHASIKAGGKNECEISSLNDESLMISSVSPFLMPLTSHTLWTGRTPMMSYSEKPEDITKEEWMDKLNNVHFQRADMNRLIMNYLVTEGFKEAAEKFRMESGIEPNVDLDSLDERIKIRDMVLKGQIQEAIALINSLHPELLDTNRYLYFHLQQQHLIELIRLRETEAALEFAQSQLAEQGEESRECLTEMERTLALLAFDNPEESPFGDLLNMMQRQKVWSEVNQAVLDYENRESTPKLAKLLKLLLWAQNELDQKKVKYSRMTDLSKGTIEDPK